MSPDKTFATQDLVLPTLRVGNVAHNHAEHIAAGFLTDKCLECQRIYKYLCAKSWLYRLWLRSPFSRSRNKPRCAACLGENKP